MIAQTIKTAARIPRHDIPSLPLCVLPQTTRPGWVIAQFYPFEQGPSPHTVLTSYRRNGSSTSGASFGNFTIFAGDHNGVRSGRRILGPGGGFALLRRIASAGLADLAGPNAVAGHEGL